MAGLLALYALISTFFIPSNVLEDRAKHPLLKKDTQEIVIKKQSKTTIETPKDFY